VPAIDCDLIERWVYSHSGRFIVLFVTENLQRVYLDPCGSLSAVYCPQLECLASTVTVIPNVGDTCELTDLARLVGVPANAMYPLDLTPRKNVWRLLPNHVLDIKRWVAARHWPKAELPAASDDNAAEAMDQAAEKIVGYVHRHIGALCRSKPVLLRLTAGVDSRMLLACARPWIKLMTVFTAELDPLDATAWLDCSTAALLARRLGLRYFRFSYCHPRSKDLEQWLIRTGRNVGEERGWQACTTLKQLPPHHADLIGQAGEVSRGFYWKQDDTEKTVISADRLLTEFRAAEHPSARAAIAAWLRAMPCRDPFLILDLFYIEQRLGCWGGVYPYGFAQDGRFIIFPLCHRAIFEAMLRLPTSVRRTGRLPQRIIEREWPELLAYPVNRARGLQRVGMAWVKTKKKRKSLRRRLLSASGELLPS
jgi:hypothetical protein